MLLHSAAHSCFHFRVLIADLAYSFLLTSFAVAAAAADDVVAAVTVTVAVTFLFLLLFLWSF